jgi:hypothetical protein
MTENKRLRISENGRNPEEEGEGEFVGASDEDVLRGYSYHCFARIGGRRG